MGGCYCSSMYDYFFYSYRQISQSLSGIKIIGEIFEVKY